MRSKMLIGVLVFALAAAVIGGATMAWFTDSDESAPVTFSAGTLLIDIDNFEEHAEHIKLENLNPGDYWDYSFDVMNVGTKRLIFTGLLCYKDTTGQDRKVIPTGEKYAGYGTGKLSEVLETVFLVDSQQNYGYEKDGVFYEGTLAGYDNEKHPLGGCPKGLEEFKNPPIVFGEAQLNPGERLTYHVKVDFPGDKAGNEYQGSQLEAAFTVLAKQIAEGAEYPAFKCPLEEEITAGIKDFTISNWGHVLDANLGPLCLVNVTDVIDVDGKKFSGNKDVTLNIQQKNNEKIVDIIRPKTANFEFIDGANNGVSFIINTQLNFGSYYIVTVVIDGVEKTLGKIWEGSIIK